MSRREHVGGGWMGLMAAARVASGRGHRPAVRFGIVSMTLARVGPCMRRFG